MGRTIPSYRIALAYEQAQWKEYRSHLGKKERKAFDELFSVAANYISACSMAAHPVVLYPCIISILLHHQRDLENIQNEVNAAKESSYKVSAS